VCDGVQATAAAATQQQRDVDIPPPAAYADETAKATAKLPDSSDADYADVVRAAPCVGANMTSILASVH
jgi:hypothetical protein